MRQIKCATVLSVVAALSSIGTATAGESKEHALRAMAAWSAFECSALASVEKNAAEQERLFTYGLEEGRKFIAAYMAGKIKQEDVSSSAPWGFVLRMQGPSADFMLGRIFESALENALDDVSMTGDKLNSKDVQVMLAQTKFRKMNCQLIGK